MSESWTHHRAALAAAKRHHRDADHTEAERALREAVAEARALRQMDDWPLTPAVRAKLAVILHGEGGARRGAAEA